MEAGTEVGKDVEMEAGMEAVMEVGMVDMKIGMEAEVEMVVLEEVGMGMGTDVDLGMPIITQIHSILENTVKWIVHPYFTCTLNWNAVFRLFSFQSIYQ